MPSPLDEISPAEVGERLRIAREAVKLKQADVASSLDIARTTLVAIEKGERRVRIGELQQLAKLYRTSVNALLREEAVQVDLTPQFRRLGALSDATEAAAELLSNLARAEVELENLLGVKRIRNYPPERPILPGDVRAQAEQDALELRKWLGLGIGPIPDIITLLEMEMNVRVYIRRIQGPVSGLFAYDDAVGACILINANHPRDRRTLTAAHEMAHLISNRRQAEITGGRSVRNSREERYAAAFAFALLMPARAVMQKFQEVTAGANKLTRRHVIVLAHAFGVSREAIVRRLEELRLTKDGTWDWFEQNGGITDEQAQQVLGDIPLPDAHKAESDKPTTLRLGLLAAEAWRRGLLSEGQLSRMLHIDRVDLRQMFDGLEIEGSEADGAVLLG
jgi:Zn-dependent peptidase ImmA (M78 family)/DNA-binding XRE family transcriptional regulator